MPGWLLCLLTLPPGADPGLLEQTPNSWVKRSPVPGGPPSPGMGYETSLGYDPSQRKIIRWGGHNQGGGGEQNAETWVYDLARGSWTLMEPNTSPPGVCCAQQNLFDPVGGRFLRFPAFSGSHGWQWYREIYLSNSSLWSYHLGSNTWRDMRPLPAPTPRPLRCASWDAEHQVAVVFGGEGGDEDTHIYDPYTNSWTRLKSKIHPVGRSGGNMAYDVVHKKHVLFGTQFGKDAHTWTYDLRTNTWEDRKPALQPPTEINDAVLAYESGSQTHVALVRVPDTRKGEEIQSGHLETWAYDVGANTWERRRPAREPDGWGNRRRVMVSLPDQKMLFMEAFVNPTERVPGVDREQQVWTYRSEPKSIPAVPEPPPRVQVRVEAKAIDVTWGASPTPGVTGYTVLRGTGTSPWDVVMRPLAQVQGTTFRDESTPTVGVIHYAVCALGPGGVRGPASVRVRAQPGIIEDLVASVISTKEVELRWKPSAGSQGYHIERAPVEVFSEEEILRLKKDTRPLDEPSVGAIKAVGVFTRLTKDPVTTPHFRDTRVDLSQPQGAGERPLERSRFRADQLDASGKPYRLAVYTYRVRGVNAQGIEGGPSPHVPTIPSGPQQVFSREEGTSCHLKWQTNPEKGLRGYRIYRMESPRINGPGQPVTRLTPDPLTETRWTDSQATKETRRYWIVAVDALGQEGIPSAPVWHARQYRKAYEPFTGPWHQ